MIEKIFKKFLIQCHAIIVYKKNLHAREYCFKCKYTKEQRSCNITIDDLLAIPQEFYNIKEEVFVRLNRGRWGKIFVSFTLAKPFSLLCNSSFCLVYLKKRIKCDLDV